MRNINTLLRNLLIFATNHIIEILGIIIALIPLIINILDSRSSLILTIYTNQIDSSKVATSNKGIYSEMDIDNRGKTPILGKTIFISFSPDTLEVLKCKFADSLKQVIDSTSIINHVNHLEIRFGELVKNNPRILQLWTNTPYSYKDLRRTANISNCKIKIRGHKQFLTILTKNSRLFSFSLLTLAIFIVFFRVFKSKSEKPDRNSIRRFLQRSKKNRNK